MQTTWKNQHTRELIGTRNICRGVGMGKQVGSMDEESQVRGCYNITLFVHQATRKQCLYWKRHKQTKHLEHESKCKV